MPKSRRAKVFHLTQVAKKTREQKDKLFQNIRDAVPEYQHCFVFSVDNMRNSYLKNVRHELNDSRYIFPLPLPSFPKLIPPDSSSAKRNSWPRHSVNPPPKPSPPASKT